MALAADLETGLETGGNSCRGPSRRQEQAKVEGVLHSVVLLAVQPMFTFFDIYEIALV